MGVSVTAAVIGDGVIVGKLLAAGPRVDRESAAAVDKTAAQMIRQVRANASGRPGPNAPTGAYRASWQAQNVADGGGVHSRSAGTNAVQAHRLEFGFNGADSIGRVFHQPPFAHFGPAADAIGPMFEAAMRGVIADPSLW